MLFSKLSAGLACALFVSSSIASPVASPCPTGSCVDVAGEGGQISEKEYAERLAQSKKGGERRRHVTREFLSRRDGLRRDRELDGEIDGRVWQRGEVGTVSGKQHEDKVLENLAKSSSSTMNADELAADASGVQGARPPSSTVDAQPVNSAAAQADEIKGTDLPDGGSVADAGPVVDNGTSTADQRPSERKLGALSCLYMPCNPSYGQNCAMAGCGYCMPVNRFNGWCT
ncbi:MAG: hypothetical protein M1832_004998 [Thelocarpon impressellum]|nr:MAG: hypothetical protein M1832_004998 [Thelocarpon impressellum]